MQGAEHGIHLLRFRGGNKISPVHETFIPLALYKNGFQIIHEILLHLVVEFYRNASEPVCDVPVMQHLVEIAVQRAERRDDLLFRTKLFDLLFQFFFLFLKFLVVFLCLAHDLEHVVQPHFRIRDHIVRIRKIAHELSRFGERVPVGVELHERP